MDFVKQHFGRSDSEIRADLKHLGCVVMAMTDVMMWQVKGHRVKRLGGFWLPGRGRVETVSGEKREYRVILRELAPSCLQQR